MTIDWRSLSRDELDRGLNNTAAVSDSATILADWETRSARLRPDRQLVYGPRERNRVDLFGNDAGVPRFVFVHGGYWQARSRESFYFLAPGPRARGFNVAFVGYTLAPAAAIDEIVEEVRRALAVIEAEDESPLLLGGWSAGAHLAVSVMDRPRVRGTLAISGIYDLAPVRHSYLNDKLQLDEEAAARNSPQLHLPRSRALHLTVGGAELPLVRQQTLDFGRAMNLPVQEIAGANHFTILGQLAAPDGALTQALVRLAG